MCSSHYFINPGEPVLFLCDVLVGDLDCEWVSDPQALSDRIKADRLFYNVFRSRYVR